MQRILIVDDEKATRDVMARALAETYDVITAADGALALETIKNDATIALVLSDVRMPGLDGLALLQAIREMRPSLAVILLTAYGSVDLAVRAMKDGADDFITKPIDLDQLELRVAKTLKTHALETEVTVLKQQLDEKFGLENMTGNSAAMKDVFRLIRQAAPSDATVLIEGPSGTGKELVAHAIHNLSPRAKGPFVAVECAALNTNLLESELFGHEKGAFTDARQQRIGRFEAANHGTIFLDEISEISPATQVKLLRVLETRSFERLGSSKTIETDIRIVAATNRDLKAYVAAGNFREDLYYRLNVVDIRLPGLKDRTGDIALLAGRFTREFAAANGNHVTGIAPDALAILEAYAWPGNVRELRNTIEKMVVLSSGGDLQAKDVPIDIRTASPARTSSNEERATRLHLTPEEERARILAALETARGNRSKAAELLGVSRRTFYRKLEEYGIE